jgi:hypothetical protein
VTKHFKISSILSLFFRWKSDPVSPLKARKLASYASGRLPILGPISHLLA